MDLLRLALIVVHLVGFALLFGGTVMQLGPRVTEPRVVNRAMTTGAVTQLVSGLMLSALAVGNGLDPAKVTLKFLVLIVIGVILIANRRRRSVSRRVLTVVALLTLANVVIAVVV